MRLRRLLRRSDEVQEPAASGGAAGNVGRRRFTLTVLTAGAWAFMRRLVSAGESGSSVAQVRPPSPPPLPNLPRQAPAQQPVQQQDAANWAQVLNAVSDGVKTGVEGWKLQARMDGVSIMAASAIGGRVLGPELLPLMRQSQRVNQLQGQQRADAEAFLAAVSDSWGAWQRSLNVPALPWYPAFAAFPLAVAPPTPNVPMPIATLAQDPRPFAPPSLSSAIRSRLGSRGSAPGAESAVNRFATAFSAAMTAWTAESQIMLVLGKGPVPSFAPPYVPVGPVLAGDIISTPGHFAAATAFLIPPFS